MVEREPVTDLGAFSSDGVVAAEWDKALADLQGAEVYWLSTVRPDGRPHVTPLLGVWLDDALYFCTGPAERKPRTSRRTRIACSRLDATDSMTV